MSLPPFWTPSVVVQFFVVLPGVVVLLDLLERLEALALAFGLISLAAFSSASRRACCLRREGTVATP